ncbi:sugar phosphate nucleotidyltransferase [Streptomyces sp. NPDC127074]|uniref:sugar phosphate nucleotidyltransferase n=1 Tax=Streptomyces sp. NPDC127074 TaxID=3347130 RepID=UPI00365FEF9F
MSKQLMPSIACSAMAPHGDSNSLMQRNSSGERSVALILGDNNLHGAGLGTQLRNRIRVQGARVFAYPVSGPRAYGVVDFDEDGKVRSGEEKPAKPKFRYAVPGRISTTIESWRSLRN